MANPIAVWDFTLPAEAVEDHTEIINWLTDYCKRWAFQLEEGDSGYKHYQGRFSWKTKIRKHSLLQYSDWDNLHIRPTSNANKGNIFYVIKTDTRIKGPWTDKDGEYPVLPRQLEGIELYPWQLEIVGDVDNWDTRIINIVYDKTGGHGKSTLATYIRANRLGCIIPPINDYKDLMQAVMCMPKSKLYLMDMPRALKKDKQYGIFSALETIKSGYAYDLRNKFKDEVFDCPNIWIFTNFIPHSDYLSKDRWRYWTIKDYELTKMKTKDVNALMESLPVD